MNRTAPKNVGLALVAMLTAGCAGTEPKINVADTMPADRSCQSLRSTLLKMEARGTAKLVDRKNDGATLSRAQEAEVASYNNLLNEYLGARCHLN